MNGKVLAGEKFKISVRFFAGIPSNIREMFLVECSHFPAERFTIKAVGIYPGCLLSLPRADEEDFHRRFDTIKPALEQGKVDYDALFHGIEALKLMPPVPSKFVDKERVVIKEKETFVMDVESECDRQFLCKRIIELVDQQLIEFANKAQNVVEEVVETPARGKRGQSKGPKGDAKEKTQDKFNQT